MFDRFHCPIRSHHCDLQSKPQSLYRLMMKLPGKNSLSVHIMHQSRGRHTRISSGPRPVPRNMLIQRSAQCDIDQLCPPADPEDRFLRSIKLLDQLQLQRVLIPVQVRSPGILRLTPPGSMDITSAGNDQRIIFVQVDILRINKICGYSFPVKIFDHSSAIAPSVVHHTDLQQLFHPDITGNRRMLDRCKYLSVSSPRSQKSRRSLVRICQFDMRV